MLKKKIDQNLLLKKKNLFDANLVYGAKKFHKLTHRISTHDNSVREEQKKLLSYNKKLKTYFRKEILWKKVGSCPVN